MVEKNRGGAFGADGGKQEKKIVGICESCGQPVKQSKNSGARQLGSSWYHTRCLVRHSATS